MLRAQPFGDDVGGDETKFVSAARSEDGDLGLLYLPVGCELQLDTGKLGQDLQAYWFDPRTGERRAAQAVAPEIYRAPDEQDWVLLLVRA